MTKFRTAAALFATAVALGAAAPALACEDSMVTLDSRGVFNDFATETYGAGIQVATVQRGPFNSSESNIVGDCNTLVELQNGFGSSETRLVGDGLAQATRLRNASAQIVLKGYDIASIVDAENSDVSVSVVGEGTRVVIRSK